MVNAWRGEEALVRKHVYLVAACLLCCLTACRINAILRSAAQDQAFRERYVGKPFYAAMVIRPYNYGGEYLIDLRGRVAESDFEALRADFHVPLGSPLTITALDRNSLLARIEGFTQTFRILVTTEMSTVDEVAQELTLLLAEQPPLTLIRPAMRPFVARGEITRRMSRREVYMSWGQPDKMQILPSSSSVLEEWIYFDRRLHLFLENGYVTNWQQM